MRLSRGFWRAVLDRFRRRRRVLGTGSNYSYARVTTARNEELRIAIGGTATQGQGGAQALAASVLRDLNPRWLFVVGIAGAFPTTEFSLGDVLLSQRMHDFSLSAALQGRRSEYEDLGGPTALEVTATWIQTRGLKPDGLRLPASGSGLNSDVYNMTVGWKSCSAKKLSVWKLHRIGSLVLHRSALA
jgi:hypothetical protein